MGSCYSAEVREISKRRRKIRKSLPIEITVTPPSPEKKARRSKDKVENTGIPARQGKTGMDGTAGISDVPSSSRDRDRFASLRGQDMSALRRSSHAGFASQRLVELARRPSLPVHLLMPDDSQRKLHNSSACVNLIQEFHSMKVVGKDGTEHYMDEKLQKILRQLKKTDSTRNHPNDEAEHDDVESDVKRSASTEDIDKKERQKETVEMVSMRRTSSDTKVGTVGIEDPEGDDA